MGFSKPKAVTPEPAPPPATASGSDVAQASFDERKKQRRRDGYTDTLLSSPDYLGAKKSAAPVRRKTLLEG